MIQKRDDTEGSSMFIPCLETKQDKQTACAQDTIQRGIPKKSNLELTWHNKHYITEVLSTHRTVPCCFPWAAAKYSEISGADCHVEVHDTACKLSCCPIGRLPSPPVSYPKRLQKWFLCASTCSTNSFPSISNIKCPPRNHSNMASGGHRSELFALLVDLNFPGGNPSWNRPWPSTQLVSWISNLGIGQQGIHKLIRFSLLPWWFIGRLPSILGHTPQETIWMCPSEWGVHSDFKTSCSLLKSWNPQLSSGVWVPQSPPFVRFLQFALHFLRLCLCVG